MRGEDSATEGPGDAVTAPGAPGDDTTAAPEPEGGPSTAANPFEKVRTRTVIPWMIIGTIVLMVTFHLFALLTPLDLRDETSIELAGMLAGYTALLTWILWVCKRSGIGLRHLIGRPPSGFNWFAVPALLVVVMTFSIGSWILFAYVLSVVSPGVLEFLLTTMETPVDQSIAYRVGMFLVAVIMAPVLEEISFRGLLLNRWGYKWGLGKALIVTSLAFGILHANPVGITAVGLVAAILYLQTRTLIVPIVLHALNNLVATLLGYLLEWSEPGEESGGPPDIAAEMVEIQASGLTGVVLVAVTLPVLIWYLRRHWPGREAAGPYVGEEAPAEG